MPDSVRLTRVDINRRIAYLLDKLFKGTFHNWNNSFVSLAWTGGPKGVVFTFTGLAFLRREQPNQRPSTQMPRVEFFTVEVIWNGFKKTL